MSNRTVRDAKWIHGVNPQYLIEKIVRLRVYDSLYWKQECFGLTLANVAEKAMEINYLGGTYAGNVKPCPFLCLLLKLLQLSPDKDIIVEFIKRDEFRYVRALGAMYLRLTASAIDIYRYLEPLYNDYRRLVRLSPEGQYEIVHMDEFVDALLRDDRVLDVILPRMTRRATLELANELEPRVSVLEEDLEQLAEVLGRERPDSDSDEEEEEEEVTRKKQRGRRSSEDEEGQVEEDEEERRRRRRRRRRSEERSRHDRRHRAPDVRRSSDRRSRSKSPRHAAHSSSSRRHEKERRRSSSRERRRRH